MNKETPQTFMISKEGSRFPNKLNFIDENNVYVGYDFTPS